MPPSGRPTCFTPTSVARCAIGAQPITALVDVGFSMPYPNPAPISRSVKAAYDEAVLAASRPTAITTCPRTSIRLTPQRSTSVPAGSDTSAGPM